MSALSLSTLVPLPVLAPLAGAAVALLVGGRLRLQRAVALAASATGLAAAVALVTRVATHGTVAVQAGGWEAPFGITLVVDRFSAAVLATSAAVVFAVHVYAIGHLDEQRERAFFHPLYLVLAAGVAGAFVTGDLFNLFVAFEVMLLASYVLLVLGASRAQVRAGMTYVVINLVASALFVLGVAAVYAATGTVNLAHLAGEIGALPPALRGALGGLFLVTFGIKAAIFPLFFWLPDSYPTAPAPITAVFAGLLTKVGVYAIIRTQTLLFAPDGPSTSLLVIAGLTMVVGVLGAVAQQDIQRILSFHIVSQIGYMVFGLALFTLAGLAAAVLYIVHHIIVKTALFLVGGAIQLARGTTRLSQLGGLATSSPVLAALFAVPALALAGLPPTSGFAGKLALTQAGFAAGRPAIVATGLAVSLLTLLSMTKIWAGAFWGAAPRSVGAAAAPVRIPATMLGAIAGLVLLSLGVVVFAEPLYAFSQAAAADLLDPTRYVEAVLPR